MKAVLDPSAALAVAFKRERAEPICAALHMCDLIIAPELFVSEATNALWKHVVFDGLDSSHAAELLKSVLAMVDEYVPTTTNNDEALFETIRHKHSVYDMLYLTLARRNNAALISLDKQLVSLASKLGIAFYFNAGQTS